MERLSRTSYHLAKTALENTPCEQTIKRVLGGAVCSVAPINPRPSRIQMKDGKLS